MTGSYTFDDNIYDFLNTSVDDLRKAVAQELNLGAKYLEDEIFRGMIEYSYHDIPERHEAVRHMFEIFSALLGWNDWNRGGSFTHGGARQAMAEDIKWHTYITAQIPAFDVRVGGRLASLENGVNNFKAGLKWYFNQVSLKDRLVKNGIYDDQEADRVLTKIRQFLKMRKDPSAPRGRKYVGIPAADTADIMDDRIQFRIGEFIRGGGHWWS